MFVVKNNPLRKFLENKFFRETFWSFSAKGIAFLLYLALNIYLARTLKVEKFGIWSLFYSIITILWILSLFGINASSQKYIAQHNGTSKLKSVLKDSFKLRFIFSSFFAVLIFIIHKPLAFFINRPDLSNLFAFAAPLVFFTGFAELIKSISMGLHRIKYNFIINFIEFGLKLVLVILFLDISFQLVSILNAFTIATSLAFIVGACLLYKNFYKEDPHQERENFTGEILKYSFPLFIVSMGFLMATEIDILMLGLLNTDEQVGLYAVAKQVIGKLPHISLAIAMGVMPVFAKLNKENKKELAVLFNRLLGLNSFIFISISVIILVFSGIFVPFIFGKEYIGSILPLKILTVFLVCSPFLVLFGTFLNYQGLAWRRAVNLSLSTALNIALNFVLIPKYGAIGAALATAVSYLPYTILNGLEVRKRFKLYA